MSATAAEHRHRRAVPARRLLATAAAGSASSLDYTETLASYGYIVAAPDHTGNTVIDRLSNTETEFDVTALDRPQDVTP